MHITKEATNQARLRDKDNIRGHFNKRRNVSPEKRDDWNEVKNYINA